MTQAVVIRAATRTDYPTVLRFHRELYIQHREQLVRPDLAPLLAYRDIEGTLRDDVEGLLSSQEARVLLAERDARPIGYVTGHVEFDARRVLPRKGVVEDWYVDASERGKGIGRRLLDALIELFRKERCDVVESGTWAFNEGARIAHARAGFVEVEVKFRRRL